MALGHLGKKLNHHKLSYKNKGVHWYTNGKIDVMRKEPPEGFYLGRTNLPDFSGENNPMYGKPGSNLGKHFSEETKNKLSQVKKQNYIGHERCWINNGEQEKFIEIKKDIPEGYVKGRLKAKLTQIDDRQE